MSWIILEVSKIIHDYYFAVFPFIKYVIILFNKIAKNCLKQAKIYLNYKLYNCAII